MRILVADADVPLLEIQQSYLWRHGHDVKIASNGLRCVAILREFHPDVMVLNHELPWGGGDGVLKLMNEDPATRNVPVILITDSPDERNGANARNVVARHQKPYRLSALREEIENLGYAEPSANPVANGTTNPFETHCLQTCPVCGRRLSLPVQLLGRVATCGHCRATFQARCADNQKDTVDSHVLLYERADELLKMASAGYELSLQGCGNSVTNLQ
jgi:DNA-binding response OmpR family regulator